MKKYFFIFLIAVVTVSCIPTEVELPSGISQTENVKYFAFEPINAPTTGFIFYPGAGIESESYNEWLEDLALEGYLAVNTKMPFNLAVLDVNAGLRVINDFPEIDNWIIGGHSLGGAMSIELIKKTLNSDKFKGLVLLAAYPGATSNISTWDGKVLSISGSNDLITSADEIENGKDLLPGSTIYYEIQGANHAQFGNYGLQDDDGTATIDASNQQGQVVQQMTTFFENNNW